jgi:hypothetical protein
MTRSVRHAAALLALAAMLLRAAIPAGWMPSAAGDSLLTMCTANGVVLLQADTPIDLDRPALEGADDSDPHAGGLMAPCAFAAAATLAGGATVPQTSPVDFHAPAPPILRAPPTVACRPVSNHPARAPPTFS